jgi:hypothetical protein
VVVVLVDVVVVVGAVVVVVGNVVVVVVVGVTVLYTISSTVVLLGGFGTTPAGSKANVTRSSLENLIFAGFVVIVGFFWSKDVQYAYSTLPALPASGVPFAHA